MSKQAVIKWFGQNTLPVELTKQESDWLFNDQSLTKRLTELSHNRFSVEILTEQWQTLRSDEYQALQADAKHVGWVREVLLNGAGDAWVYARSVAMQTGLNNPQYDLTTIGNKPLGSILFMDDSFTRTPLEITQYPSELLPEKYRNLPLWARRSSFINEDLAVLVQEIFLPAFWAQF